MGLRHAESQGRVGRNVGQLDGFLQSQALQVAEQRGCYVRILGTRANG
ncbi:hypothetical protein ABZ851_29960 [Streptomyces sp. NPDC047049]